MRIDFCSSVSVDAKSLANLFFEMDSDQQAEFFAELYNSIQAANEAGTTWLKEEYCDSQWYYLRESVRKREDSLVIANMIRAIGGQFFLHLCGNSWDWERQDYDIKLR